MFIVDWPEVMQDITMAVRYGEIIPITGKALHMREHCGNVQRIVFVPYMALNMLEVIQD